ncbi:MAG: M20/M25/M40 family metallo-hydrolase [Clostridia bacterium]|nr:M20/M25/M40 family metallo-hydrolase [Clostridia bacterium]
MELLKKLCAVTAPSGNEAPICALIQEALSGIADEVYTDAMGNLIAKKGSGGKKIMFAAHMDEIGVLVTFIEESGLVRFQNLGGLRLATMLGQRVRFLNGTIGCVQLTGGVEITKAKLTDFYIDIGAKDKAEAEKLVNIGDVAGFIADFIQTETAVMAKSLDNRVGCYVLLEALKRAQDTENEIYAVFTVQEELGLRGAGVAAHAINPDMAIALDVTATGDTPGAETMHVKLGGGAAIKIKDGGILSHPDVVAAMEQAAQKGDILTQREILLSGRTDVGVIHLTRDGIPSGAISVPMRYIHSPAEVAYKSDIEACIALTAKMMQKKS